MMNHEKVMSLREAARLAELEKTIARGKKTFVEVGLALAEIRDLRLYKREYSSFREYCQKKWGWNKSYAYYMIDSAEVVKALPEKVSTMVDTERQVRELAKVEPGQRAGVVQAIVDQGKAVTAAAIKGHLPPPPTVRRGADGRNGRDGTPVLPPPPSQVLDATGWPIPTQLIPLWQRADEVQEMLTALSNIRGSLRQAQDRDDPLYRELTYSAAQSYADQLYSSLKTAKPFAVCPTCQGQVPDKCMFCKGRGFVSEFRWNACVTREDKEFRQRAKQKAENRK
jgi:hypothetical protein